MSQRNALTQNERTEIIRRYREHDTITQIAVAVQRDKETVLGVVRKEGCYDSSRRYKRESRVNPYVFDTIDTEEKAYWLGFLYADGSIDSKRGQVSLNLAEQDIGHMEKYAAFMECTKDPLYRSAATPSSQASYRIQFANQHMSLCLQQLGMVPNKTVHCTFPTSDQVPSHFLRHFVRGYFDGDGCISMTLAKHRQSYRTTTRPQFGIRILGTEPFIVDLIRVIQPVVRSVLRPVRAKCKQFNIRQIWFGGNNQTQRFLDWLYVDATVWLDRKRDRYGLLNRVNNTERKPRGGPDPFQHFYTHEHQYRYA